MNMVYTAIFGKYDKLWEPKVISDKWEYICYTDQDFNSDVWRISKMNSPHYDKSKGSKLIKIKMIPSKDDIFIWVDGCVEVIGDMNSFVSEIPDCPLVMQVHPFHNTIDRELNLCIRGRKDNKDIMEKQISRYTMKSPYIFTHNNIIVKRSDIEDAMNKWWSEVDKWSKRDQLSFVWAMQQTNQKYCTITKELAGKYFIWHNKHPLK